MASRICHSRCCNPTKRAYDYEPLPGTYWMHAHPAQEMNLLAAPLIVRSAEDVAADRQ